MSGWAFKKEFSAAADGKATWKRENLPRPKNVHEAGITTPETLAWRESQHPEPPKRSYEFDQEDVRQASLEQVREQQRVEIARLRERFAQKPEKARRDFGTARDYRGEERER